MDYTNLVFTQALRRFNRPQQGGDRRQARRGAGQLSTAHEFAA